MSIYTSTMSINSGTIFNICMHTGTIPDIVPVQCQFYRYNVNLYRYSVNLYRYNVNLYWYSVNLYRYNVNLNRYSANLYPYSVNIYIPVQCQFLCNQRPLGFLEIWTSTSYLHTEYPIDGCDQGQASL